MSSLKCTGIAGTMLSIAGRLSPPESPTQSIVHPLTFPAHYALWGVAHFQRGKKLHSTSAFNLSLARQRTSSCRAVHAKCGTWLLLHHSEHQPLQPSHYFGPWRGYSHVYPNPWPTGVAADTAKESSTPLIAGLDMTSQDLPIPCITKN